MLNENKNESHIFQTTLQPTPVNPVVIENMTDIKESESCSDADATVKCDNKVKNLQTNSENVASTTITNQKRARLKKVLSDALYANAGVTVHFVIAGAPVINVKPTTNPIQITLPDGQIIMSTHTCNLNIPWLPAFMTEAHMQGNVR